MNEIWRRHRLLNRLQSALLVLALLGIVALAGRLLFGEGGGWIGLGAALVALLVEPAAAARLTLSLYRARPLSAAEAPQLWAIARELGARAGLPTSPRLYYVPSSLVNAFAVGSSREPSIALTDGLLHLLSARELAGVLAHELAHVAHGDLRVMGLADSVSRLTGLLAIIGQVLLVLYLPWILLGEADVNWLGFLLLVLSPHLALLAQLGLSRLREFDADLMAARLTGDPAGLASALARIERVSRSWRTWLWPGWGNPEPSWLRTHPSTDVRIARLMALLPDEERWLRAPAASVWAGRPRIVRTPRWFPGGYWR